MTAARLAAGAAASSEADTPPPWQWTPRSAQRAYTAVLYHYPCPDGAFAAAAAAMYFERGCASASLGAGAGAAAAGATAAPAAVPGAATKANVMLASEQGVASGEASCGGGVSAAAGCAKDIDGSSSSGRSIFSSGSNGRRVSSGSRGCWGSTASVRSLYPVRFIPNTVYCPLRADDERLQGVEFVYLLDFSGPKGFALQLAALGKRVVVLDHHKTASEQLLQGMQQLPQVREQQLQQQHQHQQQQHQHQQQQQQQQQEQKQQQKKQQHERASAASAVEVGAGTRIEPTVRSPFMSSERGGCQACLPSSAEAGSAPRGSASSPLSWCAEIHVSAPHGAVWCGPNQRAEVDVTACCTEAHIAVHLGAQGQEAERFESGQAHEGGRGAEVHEAAILECHIDMGRSGATVAFDYFSLRLMESTSPFQNRPVHPAVTATSSGSRGCTGDLSTESLVGCHGSGCSTTGGESSTDRDLSSKELLLSRLCSPLLASVLQQHHKQEQQQQQHESRMWQLQQQETKQRHNQEDVQEKGSGIGSGALGPWAPDQEHVSHSDSESKAGSESEWEWRERVRVVRLYENVEDVDLWRWQLDGSKEFTAGMKQLNLEFNAEADPTFWKKLLALDPDELIAVGSRALSEQQQLIAKALSTAFVICLGAPYLPSLLPSSPRSPPSASSLAAKHAMDVAELLSSPDSTKSVAAAAAAAAAAAKSAESSTAASEITLAKASNPDSSYSQGAGYCLAVMADGLSHLRSDVGNALAAKSKQLGLRAMGAVAYHEPAMEQPGVLKISLRSMGDDEDTTRISQLFGGGGHVNASSFLFDESEFAKWKVEPKYSGMKSVAHV